MKTILIIEDDRALARGLTETLKREHYTVRAVSTAEAGLRAAREPGIDLVILDILLPDRSGMDVCRELRCSGVKTPILMLTCKTEEIDKVLGLEVGADDYVTKPFGVRELIARISALLRRAGNGVTAPSEFRSGDLCVNFRAMEVLKDGKSVPLTVLEFQVLRYFLSRPGEVISRDDFLNHVWGYDNFPSTRTVDTIMLGLRKKLETDPANPRFVLTVHGIGYKFATP